VDGLDLLGAVDALATQYITLRIKHIDRAKLQYKLGSSGGIATSALTMIEASPKAALDAALPFAVSKAKEYGVDLETVVSNVPSKGRPLSEFWPGLLVGGVVGASGLLIVKLLGRLASRIRG
jgi:hypothetical protein